jgi:hypothetical protein
MSFNDKLTEEAQLLEKADLVKARRERDIATSEVNRLREQLDQANRALSIIERVESSDLEPPKWLTPAKPKNSAATLLLMLSDTHFDEVVNPATIWRVSPMTVLSSCWVATSSPVTSTKN